MEKPWTMMSQNRVASIFDLSANVYVDAIQPGNGTSSVRVRIKSLGVNQDERLVRLGLRSSAERISIADEIRYSIFFKTVDEDGATTSGKFSIQMKFDELKPLTLKEAEELDGSGAG